MPSLSSFPSCKDYRFEVRMLCWPVFHLNFVFFSDELVKIDELLSAIQKIQTLPDSSKLEKIAEVLSEIDKDHDGLIRIDVVLRVCKFYALAFASHRSPKYTFFT